MSIIIIIIIIILSSSIQLLLFLLWCLVWNGLGTSAMRGSSASACKSPGQVEQTAGRSNQLGLECPAIQTGRKNFGCFIQAISGGKGECSLCLPHHPKIYNTNLWLIAQKRFLLLFKKVRSLLEIHHLVRWWAPSYKPRICSEISHQPATFAYHRAKSTHPFICVCVCVYIYTCTHITYIIIIICTYITTIHPRIPLFYHHLGWLNPQ